ncbi:oxidoreductase-like domain-containing protein 1 isoform X2 [Frieseomelitta varia]|uniref:oxidoreductase-like domain-containing protein 1 isoform X2 n=1 Tax=Frieseomelitta varia TaxID=561572 RepID=UPI001CB68F91|nr:oxidoreductase-like domain-containing protein 1 isoform X2 [Frieseomelitta varia]
MRKVFLQGVIKGMNLAQSSRLITKNQRRSCQQIHFIFKERIYGTSSILSSEEKSTEKNESDVSTIDDMSEPTNCCMSGCANCVWIQYAEKLSATLEKSDVDVQKLIMDKVQDPNMKAFLSMELRFRNIIKD